MLRAPFDFIRANRLPPPLPTPGRAPSLQPRPAVDRLARARFIASLRATAWTDTVEDLILEAIRTASAAGI